MDNLLNLHLFANLYDLTLVPLLNQLRANIGNVVNVARLMALPWVLIWMIVVGFDVAIGHTTLDKVKRELFIIALCIGTLVSGPIYNQYIGDLFITALPNSLAPAFGGGETPMASLDHVQNTAARAGWEIYEMADGSLGKALVLAFFIVVFIIWSYICNSFSFLVYAISVGITVVCVYVGPLFIAACAVPWTRKLGSGWAAVMMSSIVTMILAIAVVHLSGGAVATTLLTTAANFAAAKALTQDNLIIGFTGLVQCGALLALCTYLVWHLKAIAQAIAGGVYHAVGALQMATFGAASGAVTRLSSRIAAGRSGGGNPGSQSGARNSMSPTGRSLSGGTSAAAAPTGANLSGATP